MRMNIYFSNGSLTAVEKALESLSEERDIAGSGILISQHSRYVGWCFLMHPNESR